MSTSRQSGRNRRSTATTSSSPAPDVAGTPATAKTEEGSWVHDYDYVVKDLRKLAIVSLSLFAIIIISGFFF